MNCWNLQSAFEHERADCIYLRKYTLVSLHVDHIAPLLHLEFSMAAYCPPCLVQVPGFHVWQAPNHLPFSESIHKNSRPKVSSIATTRPKKDTKWRCFWNLAISTNLDHPGFQGSSVTSRSLPSHQVSLVPPPSLWPTCTAEPWEQFAPEKCLGNEISCWEWPIF